MLTCIYILYSEYTLWKRRIERTLVFSYIVFTNGLRVCIANAKDHSICHCDPNQNRCLCAPQSHITWIQITVKQMVLSEMLLACVHLVGDSFLVFASLSLKEFPLNIMETIVVTLDIPERVEKTFTLTTAPHCHSIRENRVQNHHPVQSSVTFLLCLT